MAARRALTKRQKVPPRRKDHIKNSHSPPETRWLADVTTFDQATIALISRQYVVEVLAQLNEGPQDLHTLHRTCHGSQRDLHDALRALAAAGALRRTGTGASWDTRRRDEGAYALTAAGHHLVEHLSDVDAWTEAYVGRSRSSMRARPPMPGGPPSP